MLDPSILLPVGAALLGIAIGCAIILRRFPS